MRVIEERKKELELLNKAYNSLPFFIEHIFSQSVEILKDGKFICGEYPLKIGSFMQEHKKSMRVSARDHFKSMSIYAHLMWKIFRMKREGRGIEAHYFSYDTSMARYHAEKIKMAILCNPYFKDCKDAKILAESTMKYTWDNEHFFTLEPHGLLSFKRGIHAPLIYIDDPFQDPASKLDPTIIIKINQVIKTQILDMVQDEIHIVGTAQTDKDFYFDKNLRSRFGFRKDPAEKDTANKIALWPEYTDWEELQARKLERGEKVYNQEYLCEPSIESELFFTKTKINTVVNPSLINYPVGVNMDVKDDVFAGLDIGKKQHPSHFCVFKKKDGKLIQLHSKFMDGWDYINQVKYVEQAINNFKIDVVYYDNTRGEFEALQEQGELPSQCEPVVFGLKNKNSMATLFDRAVTQKKIELLNDERQINLICTVTNDLKAIETDEGHGDSFWSIALVFTHEDNQGSITII